uniref:Ribosomal RNA processing 1 n=1 Tax=Callorhinchus milii TaxID=7868 RepID=A0A4W3JXQ3_CALMI
AVPGEKKMAAAAELQFAQRLASNEKRCRDRALSKLRRYLSARSQPSSVGFTREELLKIWKGIFYCMWMQDNPSWSCSSLSLRPTKPLPTYVPPPLGGHWPCRLDRSFSSFKTFSILPSVFLPTPFLIPTLA